MTDTSIRLDRSVLGRVAGGSPLQPLLAVLTVFLPIRLIVTLTGSLDRSLLTTVATPVVIALWALGVTAHAEADDQGVRWRYYLPHAVRWGDAEQVAVTSHPLSVWKARGVLVVRTRRRNRMITPASASGPGRVRFTEQLIGLAQARGIPVDAP